MSAGTDPDAGAVLDDRHDAATVARELASKLASRARHVCLLIGAGASCAAGLPTLEELQKQVVDALPNPRKAQATALLADRNLEEGLSRLRRLRNVLSGDEKVGGLTAEDAAELDAAICAGIMSEIKIEGSNSDAFVQLASWAARMENEHPLELFTTNYDLLIELGLERVGVPYFDGFIGSVRAAFLPELVEPHDAPPSRGLPAGFVRLWKLHGSVNWRLSSEASEVRMVRTGQEHVDGVVAIYPSDEKYDQSRRVPFVVLMDRFRRALQEPETITITTGFSFRDGHLNETLFEAASRHPRSEVLALCYDTIPDEVAQWAATTRNLVALSPEDAIIDGRRAAWRPSEDIPGVFEGGRFLLGDFAHLAAFLARKVAPADG